MGLFIVTYLNGYSMFSVQGSLQGLKICNNIINKYNCVITLSPLSISAFFLFCFFWLAYTLTFASGLFLFLFCIRCSAVLVTVVVVNELPFRAPQIALHFM